jgi:hypothetical protein
MLGGSQTRVKAGQRQAGQRQVHNIASQDLTLASNNCVCVYRYRSNWRETGLHGPQTGFAEIIDAVLEADFPFSNFREPNRQYMFKHSVESRMLYPNFAVIWLFDAKSFGSPKHIRHPLLTSE